ncbi:DUF3137 domain-containing protein [Sulfurimonas sp. HSL-1716]|uniref:DUF3137 domain-containing protein n=1 Tax=Hydrocurvibacter sulfurireducens TaxID=3131937 RepID=UPI0031F9BEC5
MKSIGHLTDFYYNTLYPTLQELEEQRRALKDKIIKFGILLAVAGLLIFYFLTDGFKSIDTDMIIFFIFALGASGAFLYKILIKDYASSFKTKIIEPLIHEIDDNLRYDPVYKIEERIFIDSKLFTDKIDRYSGNDYVTGKIDSVDITFSDVHAEQKHEDSKGRTTWSTIFKGLFIVTSFNKYFSNSTIILPDSAENLFGSVIGSWLQSKNLARNQLVKMDDPAFEKEFVVYGSDQIEARYILTHSMMKRILDLKKKTGKPVYISFVNGQMNLAIEYDKDLFEPSVFRSLLEYQVAMEYVKTLQLTVAIIEELKLNERLWSKR